MWGGGNLAVLVFLALQHHDLRVILMWQSDALALAPNLCFYHGIWVGVITSLPIYMRNIGTTWRKCHHHPISPLPTCWVVTGNGMDRSQGRRFAWSPKWDTSMPPVRVVTSTMWRWTLKNGPSSNIGSQTIRHHLEAKLRRKQGQRSERGTNQFLLVKRNS